MRLFPTIRAGVFGPTRRKGEGPEALGESWKAALHLPRDYKTLREQTGLPSYYCRVMAWKIPVGSDAPGGLPKDSFNLRRGGTFAPWFISILPPKGRVRLPLRMAAYMSIAGAPGFGPERRAAILELPSWLIGQSLPIEETEPIHSTLKHFNPGGHVGPGPPEGCPVPGRV